MTGDDFLNTVIDWAIGRPDIVSLIMTGSRARPEGPVDSYSDYDLEVFTSVPEAYTSGHAWLEGIAPVWVLLATESSRGCPTRLVIFEGGRKVDFSILPVSSLEDMVNGQELNELYEQGYRVLIDRTGLASRLPPPAYSPPPGRLPTEAEFRAVIEEFWFEAWHIPKYIARGDLWVVKFRDWTMKELLLRMLEWNAIADNRAAAEIGSRMKSWTRPDLWRRLHKVFGRFDATDSRRALLATISLFRDIAAETADTLGYKYPRPVDDAISAYIRRVLDSPD